MATSLVTNVVVVKMLHCVNVPARFGVCCLCRVLAAIYPLWHRCVFKRAFWDLFPVYLLNTNMTCMISSPHIHMFTIISSDWPITLCSSSSFFLSITKTCLYNFDPRKPQFYIIKLGFTGVYIIFLVCVQKHRLWVIVRTASPRRFKRVPTIYDLSKSMKKYQSFLSENFQFFGGESFYIFE